MISSLLKNKRSRVLLTIIFLFSANAVQSQTKNLISFKLKDQFKREYTDNDYRNSIVIMIASDKNGSKYNESWGKWIHNEMSDDEGYDTIKFLALADLRGIPFFVKPIARRFFPKNKNKFVLMD